MTVKLVPTCSGALWGMADATNNISSDEQKSGRTLTVVKEYHDFSGQGTAGQFPTPAEQQLMNSGHVLHFAWTAKLWNNTKATPSWKDIANGKYDASVIVPEAKRLAGEKTPFFIDWDHEMDGKTRSTWGSAADYVAAYRHIHSVFAAQGVTKAVWAWVPTGYSGNWNKVAAYYPGNDVVDWIGWDPYNGSVKGWSSPQAVFGSFYDWLDKGNLGSAAAAKPRMLGEYGSVSDPNNSDRRAQWLSQVPAAISALPQLRAVEYWNQSEFALNNTDFTGFAQAGHSQMAQMRG
jgi:beta-mannanase